MNDNGGFCESHIDSLFKYKNCTVVLFYASRKTYGLDYYNAYTLLPTNPKSCCLGRQTWGSKSKEAGIDTVHWENDKMSVKEKRDDAIRQIKQLINEYYKEKKRGANEK